MLAEKAGHKIHVETQGVIGTEDPLTEEEIAQADVVILAIDVAISGKERFKGKKTVESANRDGCTFTKCFDC